MTSSTAAQVSSFLAGGGRIVRVQEAILATRQDVLEYVQSCGVTVNDRKGDPRFYWWKRRRISLDQLVVMANHQRRTQQLPPFSVRL